jgi:hypothetical protein
MRLSFLASLSVSAVMLLWSCRGGNPVVDQIKPVAKKPIEQEPVVPSSKPPPPLVPVEFSADWTDEDVQVYLAFCRKMGIRDETIPIRVWASESNNDPISHNPGSHASGIFQLVPDTAKGHGYDVVNDPHLDAFRASGVRGQLPWAERFYAKHRGELVTLARFYLANFFPSMPVRHADDPNFVLCSRGGSAYAGNWQKFDVKRDGHGRAVLGDDGAPQQDKGYIIVQDLEDAAVRERGQRTGELIARVRAAKSVPTAPVEGTVATKEG